MPVSRLIFTPEDTSQSIDADTLLGALKQLKLIGDKALKENHYLLGEKFLGLITFLGCSPYINLHPNDGENYCELYLFSSQTTRCTGYTTQCVPKCPVCTKRISHWKTANWQQADALCHCDKCNTETPYAQLNWKQECSFGRCGFAITHIHPHEAVPTDQLLASLNEKTGVPWNYAYANNEEI